MTGDEREARGRLVAGLWSRAGIRQKQRAASATALKKNPLQASGSLSLAIPLTRSAAHLPDEGAALYRRGKINIPSAGDVWRRAIAPASLKPRGSITSRIGSFGRQLTHHNCAESLPSRIISQPIRETMAPGGDSAAGHLKSGSRSR